MKDIPQKVHFIGIGGAGMSGIARILAGLGYQVTGSDINESETVKKLEAMGIRCFIGHDAQNVEKAEMVVVSTAIPPNNPELLRARERGIPVIHRGEMLARLMKRQKGIAVAGSHGKTTTTSMMALVLEKAGCDPTIVVGGELNDIGGNAKLGRGEYLVAEADESDGSFLLLSPHMVIITNIEDDHLDYYGSVEKVLESFQKFLAGVDPGGLAVLCYDDPNVRAILGSARAEVITYGINPGADYTIKNLKLNGSVNDADIYHRDKYIGRLKLSVPGQHNMLNALAVVVMALHIGLDFQTVAGALKTFRGVHRRYQLLGEVNGIKVIDDYAHHPTEIKATLKAARQAGSGRVISVFQPHRYSRTKHLHEQLGAAFKDADMVVINDIYSAGEAPIEGVTAQLIVDAARRNNVGKVTYIGNLADVADYLVNIARPGDIILTMGAGNVWSSGVELVKKLEERC
ncbi:UDP-N-acetylmuramate--alanine ligase [Desulfohalotomaculum tongense]|uniref:UDP-N-acetylmuramate--L-alanine ligase n=1 Tax=Desulforadius tongensis TaxID=1216062 RepID=UPI0019570812|nr:UDP-N-acetylmuramate--alanine ligase [Desulforadius tongensis]